MDIASFPAHCGSKIFYNLESRFNSKRTRSEFQSLYQKTAFAIYTDDKRRKRSYDKLLKQYKILYQSPVLVNPNTGNEYFIVIYLNEKP